MRLATKKEIPSKKTAVKKKLKVVKTVLVKVPVIKKKVIKKISPERKKATKATKTISKKLKDENVILVPSSASLRLLEKVQIYRLWYRENFSEYISNTAKYSGYAFIAFGTIIASLSFVLDKGFLSQTAAVVCIEDENCTNIPEVDLPVGSPIIYFENTIAEYISEDMNLIVKVENTDNFELSLISTISGSIIKLSNKEGISLNQYKYLLPIEKLEPSTYSVLAEVIQDSTIYRFTGPTFTIKGKEIITPEIIEEVPAEIPIVEMSTTTETLDERIDKVSLEDIIETIEPVEEVYDASLVSINIKKQDDSDYLQIHTGTLVPKSVNVYSQLTKQSKPLFLGQATLFQGEWLYSLSAIDLPSYGHYIYAAFEVNGITYNTISKIYIPHNVELNLGENYKDTTILVKKIESAIIGSDLESVDRSKYYNIFSNELSLIFDPASESKFTSPKVIALTNEIMEKDEENLNLLLQHYASAVQTENEFLTKLSNLKLTDHYINLAETELDGADINLLPSLRTLLGFRYDILKNKVLMSESNLKKLTGNLTQKDMDDDGLSDFDEMSIYQTNPVSADSDSDGVMDSFEIFNNFNPLKPDVQNVAYTNQATIDNSENAFITISSVTPVHLNNGSGEEDSIFASIKGQGIPNTYLYIIDNNSSTVGIIKTNSNGEFSYTLEKTISNGDNEITATMIDNYGSIVISSQPYKFIKSIDGFSASVSTAKKVFFDFYDTKNMLLSSNVTAAVGVVSFGLILVLLGNVVRTRRKTDIAKAI